MQSGISTLSIYKTGAIKNRGFELLFCLINEQVLQQARIFQIFVLCFSIHVCHCTTSFKLVQPLCNNEAGMMKQT